MNNIKSFFWYNKRQRNGILFLLGIIVSLQFIFYLLPFSPGESEKIKKYEVKLYPFNPNFISDYKGYQLGMSPAEIDRLHQYRAQGKYINTISSFQDITSVSDSLLNRISPYFQFPIWKKNKIYKTKKTPPDQPPLVKKDLNTAKYDDLKLIQGIGDKLASRIINYRAKIQGFTFNDQLNEVWNLEEALVDRLLMYFEIKSAPVIEKININEASFKEVLSIPYIDYALTKKIFNFRDEVAEIQSVEELKKIDGFPLDKLSRIALYLEAK